MTTPPTMTTRLPINASPALVRALSSGASPREVVRAAGVTTEKLRREPVRFDFFAAFSTRSVEETLNSEGVEYEVIERAGSTPKTRDARWDTHEVLQLTASSTSQDTHGTRMARTAIKRMVETSKENMTIFGNHTYDVPEDVFGSVIEAKAVRRVTEDGTAYIDLDYAVSIVRNNPRAQQTLALIREDGVKMGVSIGAYILDWEWQKQDGTPIPLPEEQKGASMGMAMHWYGPPEEGAVMTILDVMLLEASLVGIPSNRRGWVHEAARAMADAGYVASIQTEKESDMPPKTDEETAERSADLTPPVVPADPAHRAETPDAGGDVDGATPPADGATATPEAAAEGVETPAEPETATLSDEEMDAVTAQLEAARAARAAAGDFDEEAGTKQWESKPHPLSDEDRALALAARATTDAAATEHSAPDQTDAPHQSDSPVSGEADEEMDTLSAIAVLERKLKEQRSGASTSPVSPPPSSAAPTAPAATTPPVVSETVPDAARTAPDAPAPSQGSPDAILRDLRAERTALESVIATLSQRTTELATQKAALEAEVREFALRVQQAESIGLGRPTMRSYATRGALTDDEISRMGDDAILAYYRD